MLRGVYFNNTIVKLRRDNRVAWIVVHPAALPVSDRIVSSKLWNMGKHVYA